MNNNRPAAEEQQQLIQSVTHLKLTLPRMSKLGIPTTPENFAVWYEYSMGSKLELNKAIDDILNDGAIFTPEINKDLYTQFIANNSEQELINMQEHVRHIIDELFKQLNNMGKDMTHFRGTLTDCDSTLSQEPQIDDIRSLVTCLIKEADQMLSSSANLEKSLTNLNDEVESLRSNVDELNIEVSIDELTGITNRHTFDRVLSQAFQFYHASRDNFCLLIVDIDHFKPLNDSHGQLVGDKVLAYVAKFLQKCIQGTDTVARFGGEEFAIILPNTNYQGGLSVAEKVRRTVAAKQLTIGDHNKTSLGNVTVSIGVAEVQASDDENTIIARANNAMQQAKRQGRDCVVGEREIH